jgi:hypothetical protein
MASSQLFTNGDFIALAEKYTGEPLDWFFRHWVFDRNVPEYKIEYRIIQENDGYYIAADVETKAVGADFSMPVVMRVEGTEGQSSFHRPRISGHEDSFRLGPFAFEPKELHFNEFYSVLCKDKVRKK